MTTKVRVTHLDSAYPIKVVIKDQDGKVVEQMPLPNKGDEFETYVYSSRTLEVVEGAVEPVKVEGDDLQTKTGEHPASATPTHGKPK